MRLHLTAAQYLNKIQQSTCAGLTGKNLLLPFPSGVAQTREDQAIEGSNTRQQKRTRPSECSIVSPPSGGGVSIVTEGLCLISGIKLNTKNSHSCWFFGRT